MTLIQKLNIWMETQFWDPPRPKCTHFRIWCVCESLGKRVLLFLPSINSAFTQSCWRRRYARYKGIKSLGHQYPLKIFCPTTYRPGYSWSIVIHCSNSLLRNIDKTSQTLKFKSFYFSFHCTIYKEILILNVLAITF